VVTPRPGARRVRLDWAATAPLSPAARTAWLAAAEHADGGNPSSLHASGRRARGLVEEARERVAAALGADPAEVVLTSGGTEADTLGVQSLAAGRRAASPRRTLLVCSAIEHPAVLDNVRAAADHALLGVDAEGRLDLAALDELLADAGDRIALVSVHGVNNEIGTVQDLAAVVARCAVVGVPVHSDLVQAVGHVPVDFGASGLTAAAISGHKVGGPVGTGALLLRRDAPVRPVSGGGGQERGLRSGTLDAPGAAALAAAVEEAVAHRAAVTARLTGLADRLTRGIAAIDPDARPTGPPVGDPARSPHVVHHLFPGTSAETLLFLLDRAGIDASAGSACRAGVTGLSHVVTALGIDEPLARGALRLSLGPATTADDVDAVLAALPGVLDRARAADAARA
jgi:cysteine desulfurase